MRIAPRMLSLLLPCLLAAGYAGESPIPSPNEEAPIVAEPRVSYSFKATDAGAGWSVVNDGVMGGVSESGATIVDGALRFAGTVSLENNGGFASLRSPRGPHELADAEGLTFRLKGDGHRYGVNVWTHDRWDGIYYQAKIQPPAGEWREVTIRFEEFQPVWRGRVVPGEGPLDAGQIRGLGLIIADKQDGAFTIDIQWIGGIAPAPATGP